MGRPRHGVTIWDRFTANINFLSYEKGCWLWTGLKNERGYGKLKDGTKKWFAHRWAFGNVRNEKLVDGLVLDHLCNTPSCVNPWHLRQITGKENILSGIRNPAASNFRKMGCPKCGSEYRIRLRADRGRSIERQCPSCLKAWRHEWYLKNRYRWAKYYEERKARVAS